MEDDNEEDKFEGLGNPGELSGAGGMFIPYGCKMDMGRLGKVELKVNSVCNMYYLATYVGRPEAAGDGED